MKMPKPQQGIFFVPFCKTLAFLRGMWYHQNDFGRVPLFGIGSGGVKSRLSPLRGYSTVGSAIRSQRIGHEFESRYLHHVAARRILKQLELAQAVFVYVCASRAVVPALGQETARTMRRFQVRRRSKPHRGFANKAPAHPLPTNLLLTQNLCGSPEIIPQNSLCDFCGSPES